MAYDPAEATDRDVIRGMIGDTAATPIFVDATYDAVLGRFDYWQGAAAEMARRLANYYALRPASISTPQDGSMSWSNRIKGLELIAAQMDAEATAAARAARRGRVVTVSTEYRTGSDEGSIA